MKGKNPTKPFNVRVYCSAYYDSKIDVPANLTPKEAFQYAKDHLYDVPITELEWMGEFESLDDCDFEDGNHTGFVE